MTVGWADADKAAAFLCDQWVFVLWDKGRAMKANPDTGIMEATDVVTSRTVYSEQDMQTEQLVGAVGVIAAQLQALDEPQAKFMGLLFANVIEKGPQMMKEMIQRGSEPSN